MTTNTATTTLQSNNNIIVCDNLHNRRREFTKFGFWRQRERKNVNILVVIPTLNPLEPIHFRTLRPHCRT